MVEPATIRTSLVELPALGYGTWGLDERAAERCLPIALDAGHRHVDTAAVYGNEAGVGRGLRASGVHRDEVFLATKVWWRDAQPADARRSAEASLRRLGVDHVDLLLLHWPAEEVAPLEATLEALDGLRERGLTRHIGVSNFPAALLERAFAAAPIVTDQVEHHPYLSVRRIRDVLDRHGGVLTAYTPIARGRVLDDDTLRDIAAAHDVDPVRVTLRWHLQRGVAAIPRSGNPQRIAANARLSDFVLTDEEIARIDGLAEGHRVVPAPTPTPVPWDDE